MNGSSSLGGRTVGPWPWLVITLASAGVAISTLSTIDHVGFRNPERRAEVFCSAIAESGCVSAHTSNASEILGIPISHLGSVFYAALAFTALGFLSIRPLPGTRTARLREGIPLAHLIAAAASLPYSAWLASILVASGEVCPFCVALYGVNAGLAGTSLAWFLGARRRTREALAGAPQALLATGLLMAILAAVSVPHVLTAMKTPPALPHDGPATPAGITTFTQPPARVPAKGALSAATHLVEVSDFDCPYCHKMHESTRELARRLGDDRLNVRFVNYPLDPSCNPHVVRSLHPDACRAARAGICATKQGGFWQFADRAFATRGQREDADMEAIARGIGLDVATFAACIDAPETVAALADDIAWAHEAGVRATPTVFVNGRQMEGAMDADRLDRAVARISPCGCDRRASDGACGAPEAPQWNPGMEVVR